MSWQFIFGTNNTKLIYFVPLRRLDFDSEDSTFTLMLTCSKICNWCFIVFNLISKLKYKHKKKNTASPVVMHCQTEVFCNVTLYSSVMCLNLSSCMNLLHCVTGCMNLAHCLTSCRHLLHCHTNPTDLLPIIIPICRPLGHTSDIILKVYVPTRYTLML